HFREKSAEVKMTKPDGVTETFILEEVSPQFFQANIQADQLGVYAFEDASGKKLFAIVGDTQPPELRSVISTDKNMKHLIESSGGGVLWAQDISSPDIRLLSARKSYAGDSWLGLRKNNDYVING